MTPLSRLSRRTIARPLIVALVAFAAFTPAGIQAAAPTTRPAPAFRHVCDSPVPAGKARCHSLVRTDTGAAPNLVGAPAGYGPADLQSAYKLPSSSAGNGRTVAVVDAYDDPRAEADLAVYRAQFGLPPCTSANGCFHKVNQTGGSGPYPPPDLSWAQEISLDIDAVSAICPNCQILLVEANSNSLSDLGAGVNTAARLGATAISNSYGGGEYPFETTDDATYYSHAGVAITASTGDSGYGPQFPAASQHVTAVGGTSLVHASNSRGWSETAWSGTGSGCSAFIAKPSWQTDAGCSNRTLADVAAVADPATGVAVYDSLSGGWLIFGGTSLASPIIAATYALAGPSSAPGASAPYADPGALFDVTSGSNGGCGSYLCTSIAGYDGPTGLGTPDGIAGFNPSLQTSINPPSNLSAAVQSGQVVLSWTASTTPNVSYKVYRGTASGQETAYASNITGLSYSDTNVSSGTTYWYEVTAVGGGLESVFSNQASATILPANACAVQTVSPSQPGANLTITTSGSSVVLNWLRGGSESGYCILRATSTGSTLFAGPAAQQPLSWTDSTPPSTACYAILSTTGGVVIGISDVLCALPGTHAGATPPSKLTLNLGGAQTARLTWLPPAGATSQTLYSEPLNGAPIRSQLLSGTAGSGSDGLGGVNTCFVVTAVANLTSLGNSDVLCGFPGNASAIAAGSPLPNLQPAAQRLRATAAAPSATPTPMPTSTSSGNDGAARQPSPIGRTKPQGSAQSSDSAAPTATPLASSGPQASASTGSGVGAAPTASTQPSTGGRLPK